MDTSTLFTVACLMGAIACMIRVMFILSQDDLFDADMDDELDYL